jgi:peptidoglycan/LPS O-acetylase OafA/YrhL
MSLFPPEYNNGHMAQPVYVAMIVTFCAAIYLVSASGGRFLDITALVFLGEISYSLYLIHQMVGYAIIRIFFRLGLTTNVAIPLTIFLMIGLAFCLRTVIEKPCGRWIKSMAKGKGEKSKPLQTTGDPWAPQARVAERSGA